MQVEYGVIVSDTLEQPWKAGETAIQNYGEKLSMSLAMFATMLGTTVDQFAQKLGLTTEELVGKLDITVAQMASSIGLTTDQLAAKLGLTTTELSGMMGMTIQELAAQLGTTLPGLASQLGVTTKDLAGNLDMTMVQFAGKMGLTVDELANKFGITTEKLADKLGMTYQDLVNPFGLSMSATVEELEKLETEYSNILASIVGDSKIAVDSVNEAMQKYESAKEPAQTEKPKQEPQKPQKPQQPAKEQPKAIAIGGKVNAGNATIYADSSGGGGGRQYFASDPNYIVLDERNGYVLVRHHSLSSGYSGWFKKSDVKAYAKGTLGVKQDELAWVDEMGLEELVMHAGPNGRLQYLTKGSTVIPHDITENLMQLGQLDPATMIEQNRPTIGASHIVNNEISITMDIAEVVHIDKVTNDTIPDLTKAVQKQMDSYMSKLNNTIRSKVR